MAPVIIIPSTSEPVPNPPTILTWSNNGGNPKLSWNQSSTTDIVGYKIYRNLYGCGPDCGPYKYIGHTVGYETTTFTDYVVEIAGKFSFNFAYYYVDAFTLDLVTESTPTNTIYVPTNMAEKRAVDIPEEPIPTSFSMSQNYPNPFNPTTTISYQLPISQFVNLSIYNIQGLLIETLVNDYKKAGIYSLKWNAKNVGSGLYFYRIEAGEYTETKKCLILK